MVLLPETESIEVRDVWEYNLEEEFEFIQNIVDEYPYVAMDTEFPGLAMKPLAAEVTDPLDHQYKQVKLNVDHLKMIQLGLTFSDADGNLPHRDKFRSCVWQFNFREFNPMHDMHAIDSIALLNQGGIQFERNIQEGVSSRRFGELLMSSGVVLRDNMCWVTFHSVFDFGFLLKLLTCQKLPDTRAGFYELLRIFFPVLYDVKYLMQFCGMHGGLNKVARLLMVERVGVSHQAGSDSLVTVRVFKNLKDNNFGGKMGRYAGVLYGFDVDN
ncbi:probable CCR4-associated factor 1 homolog 6 [Henckelia pumila]|uniref:probable CCR4-associated factor 1 homolog 6 n=1 Tax=Henckelia pumila TaxID=405737 RepID=UPI003C6E8A6B